MGVSNQNVPTLKNMEKENKKEATCLNNFFEGLQKSFLCCFLFYNHFLYDTLLCDHELKDKGGHFMTLY